MLSGCGTGGEVPSDTSASVSETTAALTSVQAEETSAAESSASAAALASEDEPAAKKEDRPLIAAIDSVDDTYSPFGEINGFTELVNKLTGVTLISRTRSGSPVMNGTSAVTERYGGSLYGYSGIADIASRYNEAEDTTEYRFALRNDVRFADGDPLDADDVIFTFYLHLDPSYSGSCPLQDTGILGSINYHYDNSSADNITKEKIDEVMASEEIKPVIREKIIVPTLREQYDTVRSMFDDSSYSIYTSKYPSPAELFAFFYAIDLRDGASEKYSTKGKDAQTVISEVADMYDGNYRQLASMTMGDETYFDDQALSIAVGYIAKQNGGTDTTEHVSSVAGIVKTGAYSFNVTVSGSGEAFVNALENMMILPMHYYGSEPLYSYENRMFGFIKGKADEIMQKNEGKPLGAGAYILTGISEGHADLSANAYYYKGEPKSKKLRLIQKGDADSASLIADGTADICADDGSSSSYAAVEEANRSLEKISVSVSSEPGYGYVGINADTVRIGDAFSNSSYALRKALATAIAAFRDESVSSYYGGFGKTTDYPLIEEVEITDTVDGYIVPYAVNRDGVQIYVSGMNDDERRAAAKTACLGYLASAGYTVSGETVTSAPYGGKTEFSAIVVGGGNGDHPCYTALKKASELLGEIGITLDITDTADAAVLWDALNGGTNEIWAGAWNTESLTTVYVESYYGADSTKLKQLIRDAEESSGADRPAAFMKCYDKVLNQYAVEIPMYLRTRCTLFSALRVDAETVPADMTDYYSWADTVETIAPKNR